VAYALPDHWDWFLDVSRARVAELQAEGRKARTNGLPWFAVDATTPRDEIGSYKRWIEWQRSINALARAVPESLRDAVAQHVKLGVQQVLVPRGRSLVDTSRVERLQRDCRRRIDRAPISRRDSDAEGHRISAAFTIIDTGRPPFIVVPHREHHAPAPLGQYVTTSASQAAAGRLSSFPSQVGHPIVGVTASQIPGGCVVIPEERPRLPQARLDEGFHFCRSLDGKPSD
jgi:hypothetical protein